MNTPTPVVFIRTQDVLVAEQPSAVLRIELVDVDAADCTIRFDGETPINIRVLKPHDRSLPEEASDVCAAVYWSRRRVIEGLTPGPVSIL